MNEPVPDPKPEAAVEPLLPPSPAELVGEVAPVSAIPQSSAANWWRVGDFCVLGLWIAITTFTLNYHEKWADEAQAWLLARDLPLSKLWLHELRYEGSPGLWHTILWAAQHILHARYGALGYIGATFALAGVCVLLFATPFPHWVRWLTAFSFFFLYQYAVIARSYVLFGLFCFLAVRQYRDTERPIRFAVSLVPLALLTAHGSLLAAGLALAYSIRFIQQWRGHSDVARRDFWFAVALLAVFYILLLLILLPAADVEATHSEVKLTAAVIGHRVLRGLREALLDNAALSILACFLFAVWCYLRRALVSFLIPVGLVLALYAYADGWEHQAGTVFITVLAGLAIAWPGDPERHAFNTRMRLAYRVMLATLTVTLCYQVYASYYIIRRDVRFPYSGAADAARYLRPLVDQGKVIDGFQYGMVAINAYFDTNIFHNWSHAYYHHSTTESPANELAVAAASGTPDYIVLQWWSQFEPRIYTEGLGNAMERWGYTLDHVSDGYLFTKTGYSHRQIILIFRRVNSNVAQTPRQSGPDK
jgi:hypothetical protein